MSEASSNGQSVRKVSRQATVAVRPGSVAMTFTGIEGGFVFSPEDARKLAAGLIAAADEAEATNGAVN